MNKTRFFSAALASFVIMAGILCFASPLNASRVSAAEVTTAADAVIIDDAVTVIGGADAATSIIINSTGIDVSGSDDLLGDVEKAAADVETASRKANISDALKIMGQGMLGIFVVMILIYLVIVILNKVTFKRSEEDNE